MTSPASVASGSVGLAIGILLVTGKFIEAAPLTFAIIHFATSFAGGFAGALTIRAMGETGRSSLIAARTLKSGPAAWLSLTACLMAAAAYASFRSPCNSVDIAARTLLVLHLLVATASLLPSVLFGYLGAFCAVGIIPPSNFRGRHQPRPFKRLRGLNRIAVILLLSVIALACSRLVQPLKIDPPPIVSTPIAPEPPPKPPAFHYEPPPGIEQASPGMLDVAFTKEISGVNKDAPASLASNGSLLAFCSRSGSGAALTVFDLASFKPAASFALPSVPRSELAWSPNLAQVACVVAPSGGKAYVWILNVESGKAVALPQPRNGDLPEGLLSWPTARKLAFRPPDEPPLALDLDELTLQPLPDHLRDQQPLANPPRSDTWQIGLAEGFTQVVPPPRRSPNSPWAVHLTRFCAFSHPALPVQHLLTGLPVAERDRILIAPDGSKIIRFIDGKILVSYMGMSEPPLWTVDVEMPEPPEALAGTPAISQLEQGQVCAFAYSSLVNPLNGRVVGPDYDCPHALLRLLQWKGRKATFLVSQATRPLAAGDVVSTLHLWTGGEVKAWEAPSATGWWAIVREPPEPTGLPKSGEISLPVLELPLGLDLRAEGAAYVAARAAPRPPRRSADDQVKDFLLGHHRKAAAGEVHVLMEDYADEVDFLDKGVVSRDVIAADELAHRERWPAANETVRGEIALSKSGDGWEGSYHIEFRNESDAGEVQAGIADLQMRIVDTPAGLKIVRQKAQVRRTAEQPAPVAARQRQPTLPEVKLRLPGPLWVATSTASLGGNLLSVHDAFHVSKNSVTIHRTYRVLVGPQTPKDVAASHPDGLISMQTAEIKGSLRQIDRNSYEIYCGLQQWVRSPDAKAGEWNSHCARLAESTVGRTIALQFAGDDLVVNGLRYKLVKKGQ